MSYHGMGNYHGLGQASSDIKAEAGEMTTVQKIKAAEDIAAATGSLMKTAGPLFAGAIQMFSQTINKAPAMFEPALNTLLMLPLPQPVKDSIKGIIQNAKAKGGGPPPKTPPAPKTPVTRDLANKKNLPLIAGGVAALGLVAYLALRREK